MCCGAQPALFGKLCKAIARKESLLVQLAQVGSHQLKRQAELLGEVAHWNQQIDTMRATPGYDVLVDAQELHREDQHLACRGEANALRTELVGVRAKKEELFELNALLKQEIRQIRPSRRPLAAAKQGRPTNRQTRMTELKAMLEAYTGYPVPSTNGYNLVLSRPVLEKLLGLVQQAERATGQILHLRPLPAAGEMVPLSSMVAGA